MKIGLYFGSFNPIHIGHMAIANYIVSFSELEQLWFVISPQNPFKEKKSLLPDYHRLELVRRAIGDNSNMLASNIEFSMPQPSFTIDTLVRFAEKYPQHSFSIIMGADNLKTLHKWKNYEQIIENYNIVVYPRPGISWNRIDEEIMQKVEIVEAPQMDVSSSFIRKSIASDKDVRYFMPSEVYQYIDEMNFYK